MTTNVVAVRQVSKFAVPFLGLLAAVQGSGPNIASTALVGASRSLDMVGSTQALAASMQTLAVAATVITTGLLADRLGRRRVLMTALLVGVVGNLIVAAAPTSSIYMLGMIVTGIGLGAVYGCSFAYMKAVVAPNNLAGALGVYAAVTMFATVILTFVGGSLSGIDWRVSFLLIPVIGSVCFVLVPIILPKQNRITGTTLDLAGQLLLALGIVSFLYSVSQFAQSLTSPKTLVPLIAGLVLIGAFFVWESRYDGHFYPVSLFRSPVFLAALCAGFVYNFGTAVAFLQVTNLWQYVNGLKTSEVSIWQLPMMISGIFSALVIGRLMAKGLSNRYAIVIGGVSTTAGFLLLALFHNSKGFLGYLPGLILGGAGVVICAVPFGNLILREAPARYFGPVSSSRTTVGQFFYTIGFSIATVLIDRMTHTGIVNRLEAAGVPANQLATGLDAVSVYASKSTAPTTSLGQQALADAVTSYGNSFAITMLVAGGVIALVTAAGFFLLRNGEGKPQTVATSEAAATNT